MKKRAPSHEKKESAKSGSGRADKSKYIERLSELRVDSKDTTVDKRILELRNKIRSGYYENENVIQEIITKLLQDLKPKKG